MILKYVEHSLFLLSNITGSVSISVFSFLVSITIGIVICKKFAVN